MGKATPRRFAKILSTQGNRTTGARQSKIQPPSEALATQGENRRVDALGRGDFPLPTPFPPQTPPIPQRKITISLGRNSPKDVISSFESFVSSCADAAPDLRTMRAPVFAGASARITRGIKDTYDLGPDLGPDLGFNPELEAKLSLASKVAKSLDQFPTLGELLKMVRRGLRPEATLLADARGLSATFYRLRMQVFREPYNEFQISALALKHLRNWARLMATLDARNFGAVPYVRCQLETFSGSPYISAMSSQAAQDRFEGWLEGHEASAAFYHGDKSFAQVSRPQDVLLSEIQAGLSHTQYVQRLSGIRSEEMAAWLERGALPGGYLLTIGPIVAAYHSGDLEANVRARIGGALALLDVSGRPLAGSRLGF